MNVDGALFEDLQATRVGVVLRDNKGCVIMAASICEQVDLVSDNNENLAILRELQPWGSRTLLLHQIAKWW